jgi:hypothetical protein
MQKYTVYAHTIHRRLELASNLAALPDPANHQFTASLDRLYQLVHGALEIALRLRITAVQAFKVTQGISFGGDYVESGAEGVGLVVERHLISSLGGDKKRKKEKLIKGKETSRLVYLPSKLIDAWIGSIARIITC